MTSKRAGAIMKVLFIICLGVVFASCAAEDINKETGAGTSGLGNINVYTTIYPVYFFTSEIVKDKGNVSNLIPSGSEAHHWEPSPGDLVKMNNADAIIYSGAGMEAWIDEVLEGINEGVKAVDCSKNIDLLEADGAHYVNGGHESRIDPHIWMDPLNAIIMVQNITEALCKVDPNNAEFFKERGDILIKELTDLDIEFRQALKDLNSNQIVVSHAAFGYMTKRYNLEQIAVRGLSPEVEPGPARLAEIVDIIRQRDIKCVYFESLVSPKISEVIAKEAGVKTLILYTLGGISAENEQNGEDYFSLMRTNLAHLKEGMGG